MSLFGFQSKSSIAQSIHSFLDTALLLGSSIIVSRGQSCDTLFTHTPRHAAQDTRAPLSIYDLFQVPTAYAFSAAYFTVRKVAYANRKVLFGLKSERENCRNRRRRQAAVCIIWPKSSVWHGMAWYGMVWLVCFRPTACAR